MTVARRSARYLTVIALVAQTLAAPAAAQPGCAEAAVRVLSEDWTKIAPPRFALDPQTILDTAVDPVDPDHFFVTNGGEVMETRDAGCTWKSVYENAAALTIEMQTPATGPSGRIVMIESDALGARVHTSDDWGKTWSVSEDSQKELAGYATCGESVEPKRSANGYHGARGPLQIAPSDGNVMYLCAYLRSSLFNEPYFTFFVSKDGGATWAPTTDGVAAALAYGTRYRGPFTGARVQLYVDPAAANSLWATVVDNKMLGQPGHPGNAVAGVWTSAVLHSKDGGATWSTVRSSAPGYYAYRDLTLGRRAAGPSSVFVAGFGPPDGECPVEDGTGCIFASDDQGASWRFQPAEFGAAPVLAEAGTGHRLFVLAQTLQGVWVYRVDTRRGTWTDITSVDGEQAVTGIDSSVGGQRRAYFVISRTGIDRFTGKV